MKGLIFFILSLFLFVEIASATEWTVCSSGCDLTTIQASINGASNYDTILITDNATYNEKVTINVTGINLTSNSSVGLPIINGSSCVHSTCTANYGLMNISANHTTISRLAFNFTNITVLNDFESPSTGPSSIPIVFLFGYRGPLNNVTINNTEIYFKMHKGGIGINLYEIGGNARTGPSNVMIANNVIVSKSLGPINYLESISMCGGFTSGILSCQTNSLGIQEKIFSRTTNISVINNTINGTDMPVFFIHDGVVSDNMVDGKELYYFLERENETIKDIDNSSYIAFDSCNNVTIENLTRQGNGTMVIWNTNNSVLTSSKLDSTNTFTLIIVTLNNMSITNNHINSSVDSYTRSAIYFPPSDYSNNVTIDNNILNSTFSADSVSNSFLLWKESGSVNRPVGKYIIIKNNVIQPSAEMEYSGTNFWLRGYNHQTIFENNTIHTASQLQFVHIEGSQYAYFKGNTYYGYGDYARLRCVSEHTIFDNENISIYDGDPSYGGNTALNLGTYGVSRNVSIMNSYLNASHGIKISSSSTYSSSGPTSNITIINNTINAWNYSICLGSFASTNKFINRFRNVTIINTTITNGSIYHCQNYTNENVNIINTSFNKSAIQFCSNSNSSIYNQYYLRLKVTDSSGNALNNTQVTINDTNTYANSDNPTSNFSYTTSSDGYIPQLVLTEFLANYTYNSTNGGYLYFSNYTMLVSKDGYTTSSQTLNMTSSQNIVLTMLYSDVNVSYDYYATSHNSFYTIYTNLSTSTGTIYDVLVLVIIIVSLGVAIVTLRGFSGGEGLSPNAI